MSNDVDYYWHESRNGAFQLGKRWRLTGKWIKWVPLDSDEARAAVSVIGDKPRRDHCEVCGVTIRIGNLCSECAEAAGY